MKKKIDILKAGLERIALAGRNSDPVHLAIIASDTLKEANALQEYKIAARTWIGDNGGLCHIHLFNKETGEPLYNYIMNAVSLDSWSYIIASWMNESGLFPHQQHGTSPTIYIRDVCGVEYTSTEVRRKKDLK